MKYCYVYQLDHSRQIGIDNGDEVFDRKVLGLYRSRSAAYSALERYKLLNGFRDFPDNFSISKRRVTLGGGISQLVSGMTIYHLENEFDQDDFDLVTDFGLFANMEDVEAAIIRLTAHAHKRRMYLGNIDNYTVGGLNLDHDNPYWAEGFDVD